MFLGEGHPACLQACVGEASEEGFPFPDDPLFRRGGKEPSLSRGARRGLEGKMETCWALSGRGAECWRTPAASSEPSAARPVTSSPRALTRSGTARGVQDAGCGAPAATVTTHTPLSAFGLLRGVRVSVLSSDASARPWPEASFSCPHPRPSPGRLVPADQLWSHPWCKRSYFQSSHYCPVCAYGVFIPCCLCVPSLGRVIWSSGESIVQPRLQGPGRGGLGDGEPVGPSRPGAPPLLGSSPRAAGGRMAHVGPPWPRCSPTACGRPMGAFGALANTRAGSRRWGSL